MSNIASVLRLCIVLLLVLQKAIAKPIARAAEQSGDGEPPTNLLEPTSTPQDHLFQFECGASAMGPDCPSQNQLDQLGALQTGLDVLWDYTTELGNNWGPSARACSSPVSHGFYGLVNFEYIEHEHMAAWIGVFRAYGDHIQALLEMNLLQIHRNTLETLYSVLTSVLEEYKDVMEPYFCGCDGFDIPSVESRLPDGCLNVIYNVEFHLAHVSGDIARARDVMTRWMERHDVSSSHTPSKEEWVQQHENILNSPNYQYLLEIVAE